MSFSASKRAGFALAALLAGDRELSRVRTAIAPADAGAIARLLDPRRGSRSERVATLLAAVRPQLGALPPGLSARMAGLLAARLPRASGRAALAEAPPPRADFVIGAGLTPRLLRIARRLAGGARAC